MCVIVKHVKKHLVFWRKAAKADEGATMIEFGLLLPILITLLAGGIEVSRYILFHQKIDNATARVADLITQMNVDRVPCKGNGGLEWIYQELMVGAMQPFDFTQGGTLIVSGVEAHHPNPNQPDDSVPMKQTVEWQWVSPGGQAISKIGQEGQTVVNGNHSAGEGWPQVFVGAPSGDPGGLNDGDRVIAVETFFQYELLLPGMEILVPETEYRDVYKTSFYRARFSNLSALASDCN